MLDYASFIKLYNSFAVSAMRLILFIILITFILLNILAGIMPKVPLFFFIYFFMWEAFVTFSIAGCMPKKTISQNASADVDASCTMEAYELFTSTHDGKSLLKEMTKSPSVTFFLHKCDIVPTDIVMQDFPFDVLGQKSFELAKASHGAYVTTIDFMAAYVLLSEAQTKLLFQKHLKEKEFLDILFWTRQRFAQEEQPKIKPFTYTGQGFAEDWVTGWTYETKKYITDFSSYTIKQKPFLVAQQQPYTTLIELLSRQGKNSVILLGEPGVGKTAMIEQLALDSFEGKLPGQLYHKKFYELLLGPLLAGASDQGVLETRLQAVFEELSHAQHVIVYIPEFEQIVGASSYQINLAGALLPYLNEGQIQILASTTTGSYKKYIQPQQSFSAAFEIVSLQEPDDAIAIKMLLARSEEIEKKHHVTFSYQAIITAVDLAKRFFHDMALPGAAVDLLSSVASSGVYHSKKHISDTDVISYVEGRTHIALSTPDTKQKDQLLHLEEVLHQRVVGQDLAVKEVSQAVRRFRAGLSMGVRPISFLFLGPTGVGKTETAKALAQVYFGSEEHMIRLDMSEYANADAMNRLLGAPAGQGDEKGELTEKIHDNPYTVVLLDELEKAYPPILDLFLQVLDDGRLTDNKGKTVSFASSIIIATSNAGAEFIREELSKGTPTDAAFQQQLLNLLQTKAIFLPELLNRFDGVIVFQPINVSQSKQIVTLLLQKVAQNLYKQDITITFDDAVVTKIATEGFDPQFGARPLRRYIQEHIEDLLASKLLEGDIQRGDKITMIVVDNTFLLKKNV